MSDVNDDTLGRDGHAGRRGRPGLQAVHRLPGRLLQRRRGDLPGDAADRQERRADHDARRERDGHRRRRGADRRRRQDRPDRPRPRAQADLRGRGDQPGHPPGRGGRRAGLHRPPLGARRARRGPRGPRPRARGASPRPARSTCSCRSTTWATASRAPSSSARRRSARRTTRTSCGPASSRTTSRSSRPTTARSTSTARRSSAGATSARSPTACPGVEDRVDLLHDGGVVGGRITRERWVEIISTAPAKLFGMYPRKGAIAVGADADLVVYDPNRRADDLGVDPPHGRRLLVLRGPVGPGRQRRRPVARLGHRPRRRVHRAQGPRPVPQARGRPTTPGSAEPGRPGGRTLRVPSELARLADVREFVREAADEAGAGDACTADLVQAVDEVATNAIIHGHGGAPGWVEVDVDHGRRPVHRHASRTTRRRSTRRAVPSPDLSVHPRSAGPAGWASMLARLCVDEMTYRPRPGGGNILTLVRTVRAEREGGPVDGPGDHDRTGDRAGPDHDHRPRRRARRLELQRTSSRPLAGSTSPAPGTC